MSMTIEPEPSDAEREAILAALARPDSAVVDEWAEAALLEGVESNEPDP
jgi:hypothetical protein